MPTNTTSWRFSAVVILPLPVVSVRPVCGTVVGGIGACGVAGPATLLATELTPEVLFETTVSV